MNIDLELVAIKRQIQELKAQLQVLDDNIARCKGQLNAETQPQINAVLSMVRLCAVTVIDP